MILGEKKDYKCVKAHWSPYHVQWWWRVWAEVYRDISSFAYTQEGKHNRQWGIILRFLC